MSASSSSEAFPALTTQSMSVRLAAHEARAKRTEEAEIKDVLDRLAVRMRVDDEAEEVDAVVLAVFLQHIVDLCAAVKKS